MANPFTDGPFNCCICPPPIDYNSATDGPLERFVYCCGCPDVEIRCTSKLKQVSLCGNREFKGFTSTPPLTYYTETVTQSGNWNFYAGGSGPCKGKLKTEFLYSGSCSSTIDGSVFPCDSDITSNAETTTNIYNLSVDGNNCDSSLARTSTNYSCPSLSGTAISATQSQRIQENPVKPPRGDGRRTYTYTLSGLETEEEALNRTPAVDRLSCSSLYEMRTDRYDFKYETSSYSLTGENLKVGTEYKGCARIRRRESYSGTVPSGADTNWYDVETDLIEPFTATETEQEIVSDVQLPNEKGYEYKIYKAYLWPTYVNCECD